MIAWLNHASLAAGLCYYIDIEWWVFVLAGLLAIVIALATISYQALRAALSNPVRSFDRNKYLADALYLAFDVP